jgi:TPR repeat protein
MYRLALCYDHGIGTEQNYAGAFNYYCKAADAGISSAMYEAGLMCKNGRGTKKDEALAYKMFSAAASAGFASAEYEVGNCYFEGIGTVRNRELAFLRFTRAYEVDNENSAAAFKLGLCRLKGLGTEKDESAAFKWFCRGDELGSPAATYMLGECYYYGVGVEEDKSEAVKCYEKTISYDYDYADNSRTVPATLALAICLELGLGTEKNHRRALELYKSASETGDSDANYLTGKAIIAGVGMRAEYAAARIYILRAARKGYLPAMLTMGIMADEGKGMQKNRGDAERWYTKAINSDIVRTPELYTFPHRFFETLDTVVNSKTEAEFRLGMLIARHQPSAQSYMQAFEHIALAASLGYEPAETEISKIYIFGGDLKAYYESPFSESGAEFENGDTTPDNETLGAAMNKLGDALFEGNGMTRKNEAAAARCYKIAAEIGNNDACYSYGWCLRHGVGLRENSSESVKWLKISADRGNANAAYSFGLCCEEGYDTGIKNRREALRYYRIAASAGHSDAAQRYIMLSERDE